MDWEDTVMSNVKLLEHFGIPNFSERQGREAQAERTWPIAKQVGFEIGLKQGKAEGRREVMEWVEEHKFNEYLTPDSAKLWTVIMTGWQNQRKEWGI